MVAVLRATEICAEEVPLLTGDATLAFACHHPIETPVAIGNDPVPA